MIGALGWSYVGGVFLDPLLNVRTPAELMASIYALDDTALALSQQTKAPPFTHGTYEVFGVTDPGLSATYAALPLLASLTQRIVWDMAIKFRPQVNTATYVAILAMESSGVPKFLFSRAADGHLDIQGTGITSSGSSTAIVDDKWYRIRLIWQGVGNPSVTVEATPLLPGDADLPTAQVAFRSTSPFALSTNNDLILFAKTTNAFEGELLWLCAYAESKPRTANYRDWPYAPDAPLLFEVKPGKTLGVPLRDHISGGDPVLDGAYYLAPTNNPYL